jgi:hypothetical protein
MNELGYWRIGVAFVSRARPAFGGCIPLGSLDSTLCSYVSSPLLYNRFPHMRWLSLFICIAWGLGRSFSHSFFFPLGGLHFRSLLSLYSYSGRRGAHTAHLFLSTIRVLHLHPHTLVLLVLVGSATIITIFLFACAALGSSHFPLIRRIDLPHELHSFI